jgi:DNA-binding transcriptional LysR family regulator
MDRLTAMNVFLQVAERRSFSAAAQYLGVAASTISKQITQLETWLGVRLLERTTRRVSLTEAGTAFYERCSRIIGEVEAAESARAWPSNCIARRAACSASMCRSRMV